VEEIKPVFVDYKKEIKQDKVKGVKLSFVENKKNNLAQMNYIFPFGTDNDKELSVAFTLLEYLGTDKYTPEQLKQEFFKLGVNYEIRVLSDRINISLTGLEENLAKGVQLFNHWVKNVKTDEAIYQNMVNTILEAREMGKKDKNRIMLALSNYARYGKESRFRDIVSKERLTTAKSSEFIQKAQTIFDYPYEIFFYGKDLRQFKKDLATNIKNTKPNAVPVAKIYPEPAMSGKVYFTNYDMVQVEMSKVARGEKTNPQDFGKINVFNEYFGRGLSSIVFQEIREARSLAYSAYVNYMRPTELNKYDYITNYIGTQANKLGEAVVAMDELMANLPQIPAQFENAKNSGLKQIASQRITKQNIFFNYLATQKLGFDYDIRKDAYAEIQQLDLKKLTDFYNQKIKSATYNTAIIGKKENLDMEAIGKMGEFVEVSLEEIFGY
jgi:predicted Zn-dependent peptidase